MLTILFIFQPQNLSFTTPQTQPLKEYPLPTRCFSGPQQQSWSTHGSPCWNRKYTMFGGRRPQTTTASVTARGPQSSYEVIAVNGYQLNSSASSFIRNSCEFVIETRVWVTLSLWEPWFHDLKILYTVSVLLNETLCSVAVKF